jgi:hypothetical protein
LDIKVNMRQIKVNRFDQLDDQLNRPQPLIFIGVGGLSLQGNPFTSLTLSGLLVVTRTRGALVRPVRHTGVTGVACRTDYSNQDRQTGVAD